jgi:hypothetical protein
MFRSTSEEMQKVFRFLSLDDHAGDFRKENSHSQGLRYPYIDYTAPTYRAAVTKLLALYAPCTEALYEFLGEDIPEWAGITSMYQGLAEQRGEVEA